VRPFYSLRILIAVYGATVRQASSWNWGGRIGFYMNETKVLKIFFIFQFSTFLKFFNHQFVEVRKKRNFGKIFKNF